jgi:hypothetical protein
MSWRQRFSNKEDSRGAVSTIHKRLVQCCNAVCTATWAAWARPKVRFCTLFVESQCGIGRYLLYSSSKDQILPLTFKKWFTNRPRQKVILPFLLFQRKLSPPPFKSHIYPFFAYITLISHFSQAYPKSYFTPVGLFTWLRVFRSPSVMWRKHCTVLYTSTLQQLYIIQYTLYKEKDFLYNLLILHQNAHIHSKDSPGVCPTHNVGNAQTAASYFIARNTKLVCKQNGMNCMI